MPPLTAHKRTAVGDSPTAKNSRTVRNSSVVYSSVAVLLCAIKGTAESMAFGGCFIPLAWNLRTVRAFGLQIQNRLLTEKNEKLPFAGHVISTGQHINFV